jgi:CHAT domain-containing protein
VSVPASAPNSTRRTVGPPENPLVLSGLAFAGANLRAAAGADEDDGILTAEEVASLDLTGVEWAVLSACDTGLGLIRAGEGVLGLRRAFHVAGVRTVIMSLWSVEDRATRRWMQTLYRSRLESRRTTADALRDAGLAVLQERRSQGLSGHPFFWAGFVAAGDWR